MKKTILINITFLLVTINMFSQACGAGMITFKVFPEKNQKNLEYQLYYVSREKVDSIFRLKANDKDWLKNQNLGDGVIIDSEFAGLIINQTKDVHLNKPQIENNIINVITPELSKSLALIRIINGDKDIFVITYGGGCVEAQNAIIWGNKPKTIPIDHRVNLKKLKLENLPITVYGLEFTINNISCKWQYLVQPILGTNNKVKILNQNLVAIQKDKSLFSTDNRVENNNRYYLKPSLNDLKKRESYNLECTDINQDTYCDFQIVTERAAAGANTSYATYLFNPTTKEFEYSSIFSGANITYNPEKNRISSMWKMSVLEYSFQYLNLKPNKKEVEFVENVHRYGDTVIYKKIIDDKIIAEKQVIIDRFDSFTDLLERN